MDFKTCYSVLNYHLKHAYLPVLIRGSHGIGKSELVYQLSLEYKGGVPVVERRISQLTEGDTLGLQDPDPELPYSQFKPMDWYHKACNEPVFLFFDEGDRGIPEVRMSLMELADSRKMGGSEHSLHPDTRIFMCVNGGSVHSHNYAVQDFDPAELDRWFVVDFTPSTKDWLKWGAKTNEDGVSNVHPLITNYINDHSDKLEFIGTHQPNVVTPSRRSWKRLSDALVSGDMLKDIESPADCDKALFNALCRGTVGEEIGIHFMDYYIKYDFKVTPKDILDGKLDKIKRFGVNEYSSLIDNMESQKTFKKKLGKKQIEHVVQFLSGMPSECAMKLFDLLMEGAETHEDNLKRIHGASAIINGEEIKLASWFVNLVTGKSDLADD